MPDFDEISQSTTEIKLLPVSENEQPLYWNSISGYDFDDMQSSAYHFTSACQILE